MSTNTLLSPIEQLNVPYDREGLEDIGFMTCMTLSLLGNYAQTGHFGGPLAYTRLIDQWFDDQLETDLELR